MRHVADDGVVLEAGWDGGRGNFVAIWSVEAGHTFVYLHMLRPTRFEPAGSRNVRAVIPSGPNRDLAIEGPL